MSVSTRAYVHLYAWWNPPIFVEKKNISPPTYPINSQPQWSLVISLLHPPSPLSSLFVNPQQIDFVIRLIPYRRCVWPMCWCYGGAAWKWDAGAGEQRDGEVHRHRAVKCDGGGWHHCFRTKLQPLESCGTDQPSLYSVYDCTHTASRRTDSSVCVSVSPFVRKIIIKTGVLVFFTGGRLWCCALQVHLFAMHACQTHLWMYALSIH